MPLLTYVCMYIFPDIEMCNMKLAICINVESLYKNAKS